MIVKRKDAIDIALDRAMSAIDATARDNGHLPHAWNVSEDRVSASLFCRACGGNAAVRVHPRDLTVWSAGSLKRDEPCKGRRQ